METYTSIFIVSTALWTVLIGYLIHIDSKVRRL
jgi:hypothetical protein